MTILRNLIPVLFCLLVLPAQAGESLTQPAQSAASAAITNPQLLQTRQQLEEIQKSLQAKRAQVDGLRKQLKNTVDDTEKRELEWRIDREETDINNLRRSFENIALGGLDLGIFDTTQQDEKFNWQQELLLILKPLFQELKELTDKPRQVEHLKSRLGVLDNQTRTAQKALGNVERLLDDTLDKDTRGRLENIRANWAQRIEDIKRDREISQLQLKALEDSDDTLLLSMQQSIRDFFSGRGLNLILSILAFLLTYLIMAGLFRFYIRLHIKGETRSIATTTRRRLLEYGYKAFTIVICILAALTTLYILGDILLLALALIVLLIIAIGLRNYLPQFIEETKLLLNIGAVRERERVIYNGLPWMVRSLGVYSKLYNPALDGLLRLPLSEMQQLVSRPYRDDEPWFPTNPGDWVQLSDGTTGLVLRQTPEIVHLRHKNAVRTYNTASFLAAEPRNFSGGFSISVTFGIDYQHQAICTTIVPEQLRKSIEAGLQRSEYSQHVIDILVEFQEAGTSSLNYLIYINFNGEAADSYFAIGRLLQRICVDTCNEQGWVIPFNQLTVHAGSGFMTPER